MNNFQNRNSFYGNGMNRSQYYQNWITNRRYCPNRDKFWRQETPETMREQNMATLIFMLREEIELLTEVMQVNRCPVDDEAYRLEDMIREYCDNHEMNFNPNRRNFYGRNRSRSQNRSNRSRSQNRNRSNSRNYYDQQYDNERRRNFLDRNDRSRSRSHRSRSNGSYRGNDRDYQENNLVVRLRSSNTFKDHEHESEKIVERQEKNYSKRNNIF